MIVIEVAGVQFGGFLSAQVNLRLDSLANSFSFESATDGKNPLPFSGGEACTIFVDGELVLTGNIETVTASYSTTNHNVIVEGRSKTADLLDSSLGGEGADKKGLSDIGGAAITLSGICQRIISHLGMDILVIDEVNPLIFNAAVDVASPDPGQNSFEFLEKYSRKRQVLLSDTQEGNLLLTASSGFQTAATITHRIGNPGNANNVVSADVSYDSTGRFNVYRAVSQLNSSAGGLSALLAAPITATDQGSNQKEIDEQIRIGRQMIFVAEAMTSGKDTLDRATWEANIRKARGRVYSAEVSGFRNQLSDLWEVNVLPQVIDEFANIDARMLINSVTFSNSNQYGSEKTILGMLERDAYTLSLFESEEDTITDSFSSLFT